MKRVSTGKSYFVILTIAIYAFSKQEAFAQVLKKPEMTLEIINYKNCYGKMDKVTLRVENNSTKEYWYTLGLAVIDRQYNQWTEFALDATSPEPMKDQAARIYLLKPFKSRLITIDYKRFYDKHRSKHGFSDSLRFILHYRHRFSDYDKDITTIKSREFADSN